MLYGYGLVCISYQDDVFYKVIAGDVERRFDTSGYDKNDKRHLPLGKNKKEIGLMKDEIMTEFVALRPNLYAYKELYNTEDRRCKGIKKCVVMTFRMFLFVDTRFYYRRHIMFTSNEEISSIP